MKKYKTKNMNLQLFAGENEITDLTGTTWEFNTFLDNNIDGKDYTYSIDFLCNNTSYNEIYYFYFAVSRPEVHIDDYVLFNHTEIYNSGYWLDDMYKTITITGGIDATNSDLISWLQSNATQIQTGYSSTINLSNCTCNKSAETGLSGSYIATVTADSGYYLSSVVSSLGTATISEDKHTATIEITDITEDFTITGVGTAILYKNVELSPNANGVIDYTTVLLPKAMSDSSKQDALTTEQIAAVNSGITSTLVGQIGTNQSNISGIQELIPNQATSSNQLADKDFVNSSIATNTANFIGTFSSITALNNYVGTVTNNDYANVINQELDFATTTEMNNYNKALLTNFDYGWVVNGAKYDLYRFDIETQTWGLRASNISKGDVTLITAYNRYTYNGNLSQWNWNYTVNTSGFTANQWAAINSGITSELVDDIVTKSTSQTITGTKTFDAQVTFSNSSAAGTNNLTIKNDNGYNAKVKMGNTENIRLMTTATYFGTTVGPIQDNTSDLGTSQYTWKDLYLKGKIDFGNNATILKDSSDRVVINYGGNAKVKVGSAETIIANRIGADSDNSQDIGRTAVRWKDLYLAGNLTDGTNSISIANVVGKSTVSVSDSGTATDEVQYITINGVEKKIAGGGGIVNGIAYEEIV